jgi:hypothetical protein
VDLDITAQDADRVAVNGLVETVDHAVIEHHEGQAKTHGRYDDDGSASVTPDITPGKAQVKLHL